MPTNKKGYWNRRRPNGKTNYEHYQGGPSQIKKRASRNSARRSAEKAGKVRKGDGKDIDHKSGNPMNNSSSNLRVTTAKANRGVLNPKAHRKGKPSLKGKQRLKRNTK